MQETPVFFSSPACSCVKVAATVLVLEIVSTYIKGCFLAPLRPFPFEILSWSLLIHLFPLKRFVIF